MFIGDGDTLQEASVEPRTQTPTGNALNVQIGPGDPLSNVPVVMEFEHHQIHEGETHKAIDLLPSLASGTVKYLITVPAGVYPHMVISASVFNSTAKIDIYESATATGGTLITSYNRNRNRSNITPGTIVTKAVTSTNGTLIDSFYAGAGTKASGTTRSNSEFILKTNTLYRVDIIGQAAGTEAIMHFDWYEDLGV